MESGREGERWRSRMRNGGSLILKPGVLDISPQHQFSPLRQWSLRGLLTHPADQHGDRGPAGPGWEGSGRGPLG